MNDAIASIIVALITGGLAFLGVVFTSNKSAREIDHRLEMHQAVTDTKLEELTREVRLHNNFAQRVPVMEQQIEEANRRINELASYHKP